MARFFQVLKSVFELVTHDVLNDVTLDVWQPVGMDKFNWLYLPLLVMLTPLLRL
jgi:hypothetical protein